jgi:hypothetical protein
MRLRCSCKGCHCLKGRIGTAASKIEQEKGKSLLVKKKDDEEVYKTEDNP